MNKKIFILIGVLLLLAVGVVAIQNFIINDTKLYQKETRTWQEKIPIEGICTRQVVHTYCSNISGPSTGCHDVTENYNYPCITSEQILQKSEEVVTGELSYLTLSYLDGRSMTIPYGRDRFACTQGLNQIVCDSKEDGNGDGKCTPGETCAIFDINPAGVTLNYKNSNQPSDCKVTTINNIPFEICTDRSITSTNFLEVLK